MGTATTLNVDTSFQMVYEWYKYSDNYGVYIDTIGFVMIIFIMMGFFAIKRYKSMNLHIKDIQKFISDKDMFNKFKMISMNQNSIIMKRRWNFFANDGSYNINFKISANYPSELTVKVYSIRHNILNVGLIMGIIINIFYFKVMGPLGFMIIFISSMIWLFLFSRMYVETQMKFTENSLKKYFSLPENKDKIIFD